MLLHELLNEANANMNFQWDPGDDEKFRAFAGMIKKNNGIYYSDKQRWFLQKKYNWTKPEVGMGFRDDIKGMKDYFNIDMKPDEKAIGASGYVAWAAYGGKSIRPVSWYFVCDDYGVVAQYKLKYKGDMRKGTGPDPSKTQLLWKRDDKLAQPAIDALKKERTDREEEHKKELAALPPSHHVGKVGERIRNQMANIEASFGPKQGAYGSYYVTKLRNDNGDVLVSFGNEIGKRGDRVKISYRVKKHSQDPKTGEPNTLISHVKAENVAGILRQ